MKKIGSKSKQKQRKKVGGGGGRIPREQIEGPGNILH